MNQLLKILTLLANQSYDGNITIFKFKTSWRVGFGTIEEECIKTSEGNSFEEAAYTEIQREITRRWDKKN